MKVDMLVKTCMLYFVISYILEVADVYFILTAYNQTLKLQHTHLPLSKDKVALIDNI